MRDGLGSPYVKVFTSLGEITDKVVDFIYKYSQEEDDSCQITIEADKDDTTLPDKAEFQEGVILNIIWGYIKGENSKSREVVIRNIKATYSETKISLDLLCTNRASLLRHTSSKKIHKGTTTDIANTIYKSNFGFSINDLGKNIKDEPIVLMSVKSQGGASEGIDVFTETVIPQRVYDQLPQANKSDYQVIEDAAYNDPNGPLEVVGRDKDLFIQKRNLNQPPIKSYIYGGSDGLLLNFTPESKNLSRQSSSINVNVSGFDPENKTSFESDINNSNNQEDKLGPIVDNAPRVADKKKVLVVDPKVPKNVDKNQYTWSELKVPETPIQLLSIRSSGGADEGVDANIETTITPSIDYNQNQVSSENNPIDSQGGSLNDQSTNALKKNPAELEVVGDPLLESGKVLTIQNVSNKYSGNYYIIECEHTLTNGRPYTCTMKLSKNATGRTGNESPLKDKTILPINNKVGPQETMPDNYEIKSVDANLQLDTSPIQLDTGQ